MLLRTMTGTENWKNHAAKLHVFYSPTAGGREVHIGVAGRDPTIPISQTRSSTYEAKPGYRIECGSWTDATFDVPSGTVFKAFANKVGGFGQMNLSANQFFCMREEAALMRVKMALSNDANARYSVVYLEGRFDLLSYAEAQAMGVKVMPQFAKFSEPSVVNRMFQTETIEPQIRARAVVELRNVDVAGANVQVPIRRRGRAMQL